MANPAYPRWRDWRKCIGENGENYINANTIPFKAKAWLDLSARRAGGQAVDEKSVEKHRNDVCRLATLLAGGERPAMSEGVRADMRRFLEAYESDPVDPKALKIKGVGAQQVVEVLKSVYLR
mgnify:CR=1 FL=1